MVKLLLSQWKILLIRQEALDCVQQLPFKSWSVMPPSQLADFITDVPDNPRTFIGELRPHKAFRQGHRIILHQQLPYSVSFEGSLACVTELTNQHLRSTWWVTSWRDISLPRKLVADKKSGRKNQSWQHQLTFTQPLSTCA